MAIQLDAVPLISQSMSMSCWYASATMVVTWRRNFVMACEADRPMPGDVPAVVQTRAADNGLGLGQMVEFAKIMGFETVPLMTPTLGAIESWLEIYGPLWFAGQKTSGGSNYGHVWVIVGRSGDQLKIHDPEPVNVGTRTWVGTDWLTSALAGYAAVIPTNFMHYP